MDSNAATSADRFPDEQQALLLPPNEDNKSEMARHPETKGRKSLARICNGWRENPHVQRCLTWWSKKEPRPLWMSAPDSIFTYLRETYYQKVKED